MSRRLEQIMDGLTPERQEKIKGRASSLILEAVHETVRGLERTGSIDSSRMKEYDALCFGPVDSCVDGMVNPSKACVPPVAAPSTRSKKGREK